MENTSILLLFVAVILASGCVAQQQSEEPDPSIVESSQEQGFFETIQGQATIEADIRNNGGAGNVTATALILDENQTVLDRVSRSFFMDNNETRRIQIQTQVSEEAEGYNLTVEPS